jgi:hypothetical protein
MKIVNMRKVLDIFAKHYGEDANFVSGSDHDVFWFEGGKLPKDDHEALEKLGVHWSDETDTYMMYT